MLKLSLLYANTNNDGRMNYCQQKGVGTSNVGTLMVGTLIGLVYQSVIKMVILKYIMVVQQCIGCLWRSG